MQKKLTITIDQDVYNGLYRIVGRGKISGFIESLVRPHVDAWNLDASYRELAESERASTESEEWAEGLIGDVGASFRHLRVS